MICQTDYYTKVSVTVKVKQKIDTLAPTEMLYTKSQ